MPRLSARVGAALLLAAACAVVHAQRDPGRTVGGQLPQIEKDSAAANVVAMVYDGKVAYVRIETRERNAPLNQHPVAIDAATLRGLLARIQLDDRGDKKPGEPVLSPEQLDEIVAPLAQALGRATPEQDVSFAVSGQHGALGLLVPRKVTTGRVFYADNRLNVIFGLVRQDWESRYRATAYLIPFEPGKRAAAVERTVRVAAAGGERRRADWVQIDPLAPPPSAGSDTVAPAVVIPPSPAPAATVARDPAPAPGAAAPPPAPVSSPPAGEGDALYRQVSERLKALQKLRDAGAITEEEYQQKRREILKAL